MNGKVVSYNSFVIMLICYCLFPSLSFFFFGIYDELLIVNLEILLVSVMPCLSQSRVGLNSYKG